jgi:phosphohistidine phosphatase
MVIAPWLASGMSASTGAEELRAYREEPGVMLVGHEPDFGQLAAHLLGLPGSESIRIRKASLTLIELETADAGTARLLFSIPCKLM